MLQSRNSGGQCFAGSAVGNQCAYSETAPQAVSVHLCLLSFTSVPTTSESSMATCRYPVWNIYCLSVTPRSLFLSLEKVHQLQLPIDRRHV